MGGQKNPCAADSKNGKVRSRDRDKEGSGAPPKGTWLFLNSRFFPMKEQLGVHRAETTMPDASPPNPDLVGKLLQSEIKKEPQETHLRFLYKEIADAIHKMHSDDKNSEQRNCRIEKTEDEIVAGDKSTAVVNQGEIASHARTKDEAVSQGNA
jgi:hypothetical protein